MQEFKINVLSLDMDFEVTVTEAGVIRFCIARKMCKKNFYTVVIEKREIQPDYSGIRTTSISNDFIIQSKENHKINGLINLYGINSPGLTSSLALSEFTNANIANGRFIE